MLPCVMMTPLGSPVAPEVKRISAVSPGAAGGNGRGLSGRDSNSHRPDGARESRWRLKVVTDQKGLRADDSRDALHHFRRRTKIDGHRDHAFEQASPERYDPLRAILAPEENALAAGDAFRAQAIRKSDRQIPRGFVR